MLGFHLAANSQGALVALVTAQILKNHQLDKPWKGHLGGEQHQLGDLRSPWITMVINHLQTGMILQVGNQVW